MKILKLLTALCFFMGILITHKGIGKKCLKADVIMNNIEALATSETIEVLERCDMIGTEKCPAGGYARVVFLNNYHNVIKK